MNKFPDCLRAEEILNICYFSRRHFLKINIYHKYLSGLREKERRLKIQGCSVILPSPVMRRVRFWSHLLHCKLLTQFP